MDRSIPLGRLAGIRVAMSWIVPVMALVYAWTLADRLLPAAVPEQSGSAYWIVGTAGAALLFVSLLVHEMGHALVGRREGLSVRGITLTMLGGHTQFVTEPTTAGAELRVSGVGPAANALLAVLFWAGAQALTGDASVGGAVDGTTPLLVELFGYLALLNLAVALLNILPATPLDGGVVLEALLWMATRDRSRASRIASMIGMALGVGLVGVGFLAAQDGSSYGMFAIVGGLAVVYEARSRLRDAPVIDRLRDTRLGQVMVPDPPVVPEWSTLADVVARAEAWRPHTAFPVQAPDGSITGLLTAELVLAVAPEDWAVVRAGDVAWPLDRIPTARVDEPVLTGLHRAESAGIDRILVVRADGRVVGTAGRDAARRALRPT